MIEPKVVRQLIQFNRFITPEGEEQMVITVEDRARSPITETTLIRTVTVGSPVLDGITADLGIILKKLEKTLESVELPPDADDKPTSAGS